MEACMAARAGGNASSAMTRREGGPVPRGGGGQGAAQQDRYQPGPLPPGGPPGLEVYPSKRPKEAEARRQVSVFYSGSSVCDLTTGEPWQMEVKLK